MKNALHVILWVSLSVAAFLGVLLGRTLVDLSGEIISSPGPAGSAFDHSAWAYGIVVCVVIATAAACGLMAGRRWVAPDDPAYPQPSPRRRLAVLTIAGRPGNRWDE